MSCLILSTSESKNSILLLACTHRGLYIRQLKRNEAGARPPRKRAIRFFGIVFKSLVGTAVLALVAVPTRLQAQSSECWVSGHSQSRSRAEFQEGSNSVGLYTDLGFDAKLTSTASEHNAGPAKLTLDLNPSSAFPGFCSTITRCSNSWFSCSLLPAIARAQEPPANDSKTDEGNKAPIDCVDAEFQDG